MKNNSTQETVISALSAGGCLTTHALSQECRIEEPAIRYHLRKLKLRGLVREFAEKDQGLKVGRKASRYWLVRADSNRIVNLLCRAFLVNSMQIVSKEKNPDQASVLSAAIIREDMRLSGSDPSIPLPVRKLMDWLNLNNFSASWVAGKFGPVIQFKNCPYRDIRSGNDILCEVDVWLLQTLGGLNWQLDECKDWENMTGCCRFIVKPGPSR